MKRVYALSFLLLGLAVLYALDWTGTLLLFSVPQFFVFLAFVPGVLAVVYHLVTVRQRREHNFVVVDTYYAWRNKRARPHQKDIARYKDPIEGPVSAIAATVLLTAVFLFVANIAGYHPTSNAKSGIVYAGLGAYISVLYYMVARLYASALSSRFLMASAIGSASSVAMGWVFGTVGTSILGADATNFNLMTVLFLTGLFHKWAFDALRRRARKLFGQPEPETVELPITFVEGIDDVQADLLTEYGVTTVQHLATAEPGEVCERTLLPFDRVIDWMDQAILITYLKKNITAARSLGIRGAINLVLIWKDGSEPKSKLLDSLGEKASMPRAAIDAIAKELHDDYTVRLIYELREGKPLAPAQEAVVKQVVDELNANYVLNDTKIDIKPKPASA